MMASLSLQKKKNLCPTFHQPLVALLDIWIPLFADAHTHLPKKSWTKFKLVFKVGHPVHF